MNSRYLVAFPIVLALSAGCGGGEAGGDDTSVEADQPAAEGEAPSADPSGAIDQELADLGESLFQSKGCIGCHTIGSGRLTGPDLKGVTERREFDWMAAMMTNPDSMLKDDPVARQLLGEYMTPMLNMGVTADDVRAIYEYLRSERQ